MVMRIVVFVLGCLIALCVGYYVGYNSAYERMAVFVQDSVVQVGLPPALKQKMADYWHKYFPTKDQSEIDETSALLVGEWQDVDDSTITRIFSSDGSVHESIKDKPVAESYSYWNVLSGDTNTVWNYIPLEKETKYIEINYPKVDALLFKVVKLTDTSLELVFMNKGGTLRYTRIK